MSENPFEKAITDDFDLCKPMADYERVYGAMYHAGSVLGTTLDRVKPKIFLQLEHLQVVDYSAFPDVPPAQRKYISGIQTADPIRAEEMAFLALRSMVAFSWPEPKSNDDLLRSVEFEFLVNKYLVQAALDIGPSLKSGDCLLPYWGRLSFLRAMRAFPDESIDRYRLANLSVALLKAPSMNARTIIRDEGPVIGLNYALEPLLTCMNRYIYHFMHTRHMAGPARVKRAWRGFLPVVLYFWGTMSAFGLADAGCSVFFDETTPQVAMYETIQQLDFILLHEVGHTILNHPTTMQLYKESGPASQALRHEFEFAADAFALAFFRSQTFNDLRYTLNPKKTAGQDGVPEDRTEPILDYVTKVDSVQLLLTYMDFIDQAGRMLKSRLGHAVNLRDVLDSHPSPKERWARLEVASAGDRLFSRPTTEYAKELFDQVLAFGSGLNESELQDDVRRLFGS